MKRKLIFKTAVIAVLTLIAVYFVIGIPRSIDELRSNWSHNVRLGLDLRGGVQVLLQVQLQDAFNSGMASAADRLRAAMEKEQIRFASAGPREAASPADVDRAAIVVRGVAAADAARVTPLIADQLPGFRMSSASPDELVIGMEPARVASLRQQVLEQCRDVVERKINALGLSESTVQITARTPARAELFLQIPGVDELTHIKSLIETPAVLEWRDVLDGPFATREDGYGAHQGLLPHGSEMVTSAARNGKPGLWYLVSTTTVVRGSDIRDAHAQLEPGGGWVTTFVLSQEAAKRFEPYTTSRVGQRAAILLDKQAISVAVIENTIRDSGQVRGAGNQAEASDLALNLRAGAMPAHLTSLGDLNIGPSLGADSIRDGLRAGMVGLASVVSVMVAYYGRHGWNAVAALLLNAVFLFGALCGLHAALSLPGLAGLVLTIGMAVDSNVLIFERLREEMRAGKTLGAAVETAFSKAFLTIIDTHMTSIVACACLFYFGTPAIRGFAVTLSIGLIANVLTSVYVSRLIFDWGLLRGSRQHAANTGMRAELQSRVP